MELTIDEIYKKLGLQNPFEYARKKARKNLSESEVLLGLAPHQRLKECSRGIGYTTYMLVHAMQELAKGGKIVVSGGYALDKARTMASQLGLDASKIVTTLDMFDETVVPIFNDRKWSL